MNRKFLALLLAVAMVVCMFSFVACGNTENKGDDGKKEEKVEVNKINMIHAIDDVVAGQVTYAVRTTKIDDFNVKKGDIIGLNDKKILAKGSNIKECTISLIESLKTKNHYMVNMYYGNDISEEINELYKSLVFNDMTTRIYHLNIYLGEDRKNWFEKEVVNFIENCQLTQLDYCELLRQYDLYESDKDAYFNLIKDYRNLSEILGDEDVTHVYKIFLKGYKKTKKMESFR